MARVPNQEAFRRRRQFGVKRRKAGHHRSEIAEQMIGRQIGMGILVEIKDACGFFAQGIGNPLGKFAGEIGLSLGHPKKDRR
jgi:hypothetical protein